MNDDSTRLRFRLVGIIAVSLFVAMFARLWFVQVVDAESYQEEASANIFRHVATPAPRGHILDANEKVIVDNRLSNVLVVDRQAFARAGVTEAQRADMLVLLAEEINAGGGPLVKGSDLERAFDSENYSNLEEVPIAWDVPEDLLIFVGERPDTFPGLRVTKRIVRDYPYGSVAAHVVGYVGAITGSELDAIAQRWEERGLEAPKPYRRRDDIGKTGVELLFEDELRGTPGQRVYEVDNRGNIVRELVDQRVEPVPGNDIALTIDVDLQAMVEHELEAALRRARDQSRSDPANDPAFAAPAGSAVVLDPQDGSVRAMASYPTYEPADLIDGVSAEEWRELNEKSNHSPILNRAIQSTYAPGSTFKLLTAHAALTEPSISTGTGNIFGTPGVPDYYEKVDDDGSYTLRNCEGDRCVFYNAGRLPTYAVDLPRSLTVSSDTYYYRLGEAFWIKSDFDDEAIQNSAAVFGLGRVSGIELPNEKSGVIPTEELKQQRHRDNPEAFPFGDWFTGDNVNLAIGQGDVSITPLQLVNAYATFANGGTLYSPSVVAEIRAHDGELIQEFGPRVRDEIELDPAQADLLMQGLVGVTSQADGTAFVPFNVPDEGGVNFPVEACPIAAKTGTAEVNDKADTSLFVAFGCTDDPQYGVSGRIPRYAVAAVLEESGFGSSVAAPMVANLMLALYEDTVPSALTAAERADAFVARNDTATTTTVVEGEGTGP
ncbi:MAG: penicillin-binding protein 2 [Acidimicrobiia bacterium]|nr:penicillin-binding protein 2 [Acidimicrobiia bacterium]